MAGPALRPARERCLPAHGHALGGSLSRPPPSTARPTCWPASATSSSIRCAPAWSRIRRTIRGRADAANACGATDPLVRPHALYLALADTADARRQAYRRLFDHRARRGGRRRAARRHERRLGNRRRALQGADCGQASPPGDAAAAGAPAEIRRQRPVNWTCCRKPTLTPNTPLEVWSTRLSRRLMMFGGWRKWL